MMKSTAPQPKTRLVSALHAAWDIRPMTLTALCMMVAPMAHAQQTINLTSANPTYDVGNATYPITGLTVADNVNGFITGAGGTLQYAGGSPFVLGSTTNSAAQNLDMSGLSNF